MRVRSVGPRRVYVNEQLLRSEWSDPEYERMRTPGLRRGAFVLVPDTNVRVVPSRYGRRTPALALARTETCASWIVEYDVPTETVRTNVYMRFGTCIDNILALRSFRRHAEAKPHVAIIGPSSLADLLVGRDGVLVDLSFHAHLLPKGCIGWIRLQDGMVVARQVYFVGQTRAPVAAIRSCLGTLQSAGACAHIVYALGRYLTPQTLLVLPELHPDHDRVLEGDWSDEATLVHADKDRDVLCLTRDLMNDYVTGGYHRWCAHQDRTLVPTVLDLSGAKLVRRRRRAPASALPIGHLRLLPDEYEVLAATDAVLPRATCLGLAVSESPHSSILATVTYNGTYVLDHLFAPDAFQSAVTHKTQFYLFHISGCLSCWT
jgi:hypothetical protein